MDSSHQQSIPTANCSVEELGRHRLMGQPRKRYQGRPVQPKAHAALCLPNSSRFALDRLPPLLGSAPLQTYEWVTEALTIEGGHLVSVWLNLGRPDDVMNLWFVL